MNPSCSARFCLLSIIFGLFWPLTAANAQDARLLTSGQTLYLPIYSHMLYGNIGKSGKVSQVMLSALVSIRNTDPRRPMRILSARYYDTSGKLIGERLRKVQIIRVPGNSDQPVQASACTIGSSIA